MKFKLHDDVYNVLKWVALIALPAVAVLYNALAAVWKLPCSQEVSTTINAVIAFIGALIGLSTVTYNEENQNGKSE